MCMYVSEICAEEIFVTFPWWLKNVKSRSKITLFSNERHFETWFPKKKTITFFWSKLSKLYKKDQILHVATIFSLKQGETRTSHGPIPHPLISRACWQQHYFLRVFSDIVSTQFMDFVQITPGIRLQGMFKWIALNGLCIGITSATFLGLSDVDSNKSSLYVWDNLIRNIPILFMCCSILCCIQNVSYAWWQYK